MTQLFCILHRNVNIYGSQRNVLKFETYYMKTRVFYLSSFLLDSNNIIELTFYVGSRKTAMPEITAIHIRCAQHYATEIISIHWLALDVSKTKYVFSDIATSYSIMLPIITVRWWLLNHRKLIAVEINIFIYKVCLHFTQTFLPLVLIR